MYASEFASLYPPNMDGYRYHENQDGPDLTATRNWSEDMGETIHNYLSTDPLAPLDTHYLAKRTDWLKGNLGSATDKVDATSNIDARSHALNELAGPALALNMTPMFHQFTTSEWSQTERTASIRKCKDMLGISAMGFIRHRERNAAIESGHKYFDPSMARERQTLEGILNEFDTAIVLLEIARKHPTLTVVPSLAQFEHGKNTSLNSDFLVVDRRGYIVGVQAKTTTTAETIRKYDDRAIVVVDGSIDMGSAMYKRVKKGSSYERRVSWAGLICANVVANMELHGPNAHFTNVRVRNGKSRPQHFLQERLAARKLIGTLQPQLHVAAQTVGTRVLHKLYEATDLQMSGQ